MLAGGARRPESGRRRYTALLLAGVLGVTVAEAASTGSPRDALVEAGRRVYVEGLLPDGSPLQATRADSVVLEGRNAACVTCHRESGMGSIEGVLENTILVPPIAGPLLFAPARFHGAFLDSAHHWVPNEAWERALTRGAYDEASLARALREGVDPDGIPLSMPMFTYDLDDTAVASLTAYLRQLSAEPAPGVEPDALHLATVITPDAPPGQSDAVLGVVRTWADSSRASGTAWRLHVWELSGPPETWRAQLEDKYREQPVFAVLSGAGGIEWTPVHRFCEDHRVPCVLPVVDAAPTGESGFYSMYFSPGVSLEARLLASHLAGDAAPGPVVQVYADEAGRLAADELASALAPAPDSGSARARRFRPTAPAATLREIGPDATLVLWLRPAEIVQLEAVLPEGPGAAQVFVSALLAPPKSVSLPAAWKARVTWVSLFDDLSLQAEIARLRLKRWLEQRGLKPAANLRWQGDAYAACYLLADALGDIRGQELRRPRVPLSREHLLEMLENEVDKYSDGTEFVDPDSHVAFYGRMSLGPGQRTAVRGGTLIRYVSPDTERLVEASERIIP